MVAVDRNGNRVTIAETVDLVVVGNQGKKFGAEDEYFALRVRIPRESVPSIKEAVVNAGYTEQQAEEVVSEDGYCILLTESQIVTSIIRAIHNPEDLPEVVKSSVTDRLKKFLRNISG